MRRSFAIAGIAAALSLAASPALAFQETSAPPPEANGAAPQANAPALQLGTPGTAAPKPNADNKGGVKVFGYSILPKLNFGLELLYGQDQPQQQMDLQGPTFEDENPDVTVLGKVRRRF
jgi:hypothetical protein